jgi:hypothetical protein
MNGMTAIVLFLVAALLVGVFAFGSRRSTAARPRSVDAEVIEQLRQAGSDLSKPHEIEFFLYFPAEANAEAAAKALPDRGFSHRVTRAARGTESLLLLTRPMIPDEAGLAQLRRELDAIARQHGGKYDGWGSPVVD